MTATTQLNFITQQEQHDRASLIAQRKLDLAAAVEKRDALWSQWQRAKKSCDQQQAKAITAELVTLYGVIDQLQQTVASKQLTDLERSSCAF